jgi:hypothetical protein
MDERKRESIKGDKVEVYFVQIIHKQRILRGLRKRQHVVFVESYHGFAERYQMSVIKLMSSTFLLGSLSVLRHSLKVALVWLSCTVIY